MAITITKVAFTADQSYAGKNARAAAELTVDVAFDSSYPTGGETMDVSTWLASVSSCLHVPADIEAEGGPSGVYAYAHDKGTAAAGLLLVYQEDAATGIYAQVANTTNISALTAVRFKLTGPVASNYAAAAPASTSNLGAY